MSRGADIPSAPTAAFIGIGSNVGDRDAHIAHARARLADLPATQLVACSDIIETDPVGGIEQGRYLNAVAQLSTRLSPRQLLSSLMDIERERGRDRAQELRMGPRTLDLDLLVFGDWEIQEPGLQVPHPRMWEREFVVRPLLQIAPNFAEAVRIKALH